MTIRCMGYLWRLLFPLGFWPTFTCRVGTQGGTSNQPYTKEEEEKMAAILQERKEKKEAKKKALQEEQAAKLKKIEEEMAREKERLKKEEEERLKEMEEEEEDETPLQRRKGQHSGRKDEEMEKGISEWVANLSLGEEEEVTMYIPKDEQEAAMKKWEEEEDVLKRQAMQDETRMVWKLAMMREKKRRVETSSAAMQELAEVRTLTTQLTTQVDLQQKVQIIAQSVKRLARVQEQQYEFSRSQDIVVRSMRMGFRDFARELVVVGAEVNHRLASAPLRASRWQLPRRKSRVLVGSRSKSNSLIPKVGKGKKTLKTGRPTSRPTCTYNRSPQISTC
ncbi:hypothetical protein CBR_g30 [Chara braunii]|uniref:Uncharacterized protein n=1 Tax=Chara braunii TaxID=69332 RepID=A0A388JLE3_CHABU|nr:hypothetical protein CBR_g30 [Chara braunii]|eukprot:GBG58630.1 hypothetical protein CBR_g30 [Chara braunii]